MADNVPPMRGMLLVRGNKSKPREFSSTKLNPATMAIKIASFRLIQMFVSDGILSAFARTQVRPLDGKIRNIHKAQPMEAKLSSRAADIDNTSDDGLILAPSPSAHSAPASDVNRHSQATFILQDLIASPLCAPSHIVAARRFYNCGQRNMEYEMVMADRRERQWEQPLQPLVRFTSRS